MKKVIKHFGICYKISIFAFVNAIKNKVVTKQNIKDVHALGIKKHRDATQTFVAEGPKVVGDLLPLMHCRAMYATKVFLNALPSLLTQNVDVVEVIDQKTLERLSLLCAPRDVLAVFEKPTQGDMAADLLDLPKHALCLALDAVQDPGNLGTIVRLADWFGIEHIFASHDTADVFAPKVVQATMGAIGRVKVHYCDLPQVLYQMKEVPVYGTFLDGTNVYAETLTPNGLIVMGNEGRGISAAVESCVNKRLYIPPYPEGRATSESLNVAIATAVVCAEFRRTARQ